MDKIYTHDEIVELLTKHECEVTFKKIDGEIRVMPCTLSPEVLPPQQPLAEGKVPRKPNPNVVSAWSLDRSAWRSFKVENVISVTVIK
jgi:hypothetical protein